MTTNTTKLSAAAIAEMNERVYEISHATLHGPVPLKTTMQFVIDLSALLADREVLEAERREMLGALERARQARNRLEAELQEMQDLVTFYQGEGEAQVPEEDEYRKLASISPAKRTKEQSERLRFLATKIVRLCDPKSLRAELQEARESIAEHRCLPKKVLDDALANQRTQLVAAVRARMPLFNGTGGLVIKLIEEFEVRGA